MIKLPNNFVHIQLNSTEEFKMLDMFKERRGGKRERRQWSWVRMTK